MGWRPGSANGADGAAQQILGALWEGSCQRDSGVWDNAWKGGAEPKAVVVGQVLCREGWSWWLSLWHACISLRLGFPVRMADAAFLPYGPEYE